MILPVTPNEVPSQNIPDYVIESFNTLIRKNMYNGVSIVYVDDIIGMIFQKFS